MNLCPSEIYAYSSGWFRDFFLETLVLVVAKTGGSSVGKSLIGICFWGTVAMAMTALVGYILELKQLKLTGSLPLFFVLKG